MQLILSAKVAALAMHAFSEIDDGTAIDGGNRADGTVRGGPFSLPGIREESIERPSRRNSRRRLRDRRVAGRLNSVS
jgi:hypothetical protein